MDLESVWIIAKKDFNVFKKRKSIIYTSVVIPLGMP